MNLYQLFVKVYIFYESFIFIKKFHCSLSAGKLVGFFIFLTYFQNIAFCLF